MISAFTLFLLANQNYFNFKNSLPKPHIAYSALFRSRDEHFLFSRAYFFKSISSKFILEIRQFK